MRLTEILSPDGSKIYIQYDEEDSDELQAVGYLDNIHERTEKLRQSMTSTIRGYSQTVLSSVEEAMADLTAPSKLTLEFGLQVGGETGVPFIAKGTAQANMQVTVEWELNKNKQS